MRKLIACLAVATTLTGCNTIQKTEPPAGTLPTGKKVLVDDGTCPAGQVKEVIGSTPGVPRKKSCVPHPNGAAAAVAPASAQNAEALVGRWSGNLPNGASILLDIPKSGKPSYRFKGMNVAVVSARASGNSLVLSVGRGYGNVTVTPSGGTLAYTYSDREGTAKAVLTRS